MLGVIVRTENSVAEPKRLHAMTPITITISAGSHMPIAPILCIHLPMLSPMMLSQVMKASAISAKPMKNIGLLCRCIQLSPPM